MSHSFKSELKKLIHLLYTVMSRSKGVASSSRITAGTIVHVNSIICAFLKVQLMSLFKVINTNTRAVT